MKQDSATSQLLDLKACISSAMTWSATRRACAALALFAAVLYCLSSESSAVHQKRQVYRGFHQGLNVHAVPALQPVRKLSEEEKEAFRASKRAYLQQQKVPGRAGIDYPTYHEVPDTHFSCHDVPYVPGMYANVETGCQAYHVCHDGREGHQGASFLCPNGTLFNQYEFNCDWWYNVDCSQARGLYGYNGDPEKNPYYPKKKTLEQLADVEHGAYAAAVQQQGRYEEAAEQYHRHAAF